MKRVLLLLSCLSFTASASAQADVVVGSKAFTESRILGELIAQWLERTTELRVERRLNLGGTLVAFQALEAGEIDVYAEYTGTAWAVQLGESSRAGSALQTYVDVQRRFRSRFDVEWAPPFGFENGYALMMREERAAALGIERISDLRAHPELRFALSHEFVEREDGYSGLRDHYALPHDPRGVEHALAYEGLIASEVDVVDTYTTDGATLRVQGRLLQDDRGFFPPYDCAPIVRGESWRAHPALRHALEELAFRIDDEAMRRMNAAVEGEGRSHAEAARAFLDELAPSEEPAEDAAASDESGWILWSRIFEHLWLSALSVLLAALFGLPLGIAIVHRRRLAKAVLSVAGVLQTVPSLALLALLIPVPGLGIGSTSAVVALVLYALLPILRNTYTGIRSVDPLLREAAEGLGLTSREILLRIELPLAARTIFGGLRTAAVISVGVATVGAFIGAGGLGQPILTGLQLGRVSLVLQGAIPAAVLALFVDGGLALAERAFVPAHERAS